MVTGKSGYEKKFELEVPALQHPLRRPPAVRISRGLSLDEFSALLGISKQVLRRYEQGLRCPLLTEAWKFSRTLGIPFHVLVGERPPDSLR